MSSQLENETRKYQRLREELRDMCDTCPLFLNSKKVQNLLIEVHNS